MSEYKRKKTPGNTEWFIHDRFGMFIHFGLYAMAGRGEWVKSIEQMTNEDYEKYFTYFNPDLFDAKDWARRAKEAGMKYAVLTARHHEGFCLFDTKYTDYKITNTPFGRDLVKEYVEAFREAGLKVGLYYSLLDWYRDDYTIDCYHPQRLHPDAEKISAGRNMKTYAEFMRNQVTELLTNYGKIDIIWFDFSFDQIKEDDALMTPLPAALRRGKGKNDWEAEKLIELARTLQPGIIIDNRTGIEQDISTPEQYQVEEWPRFENGEYKTWEACQTFSGAWGFSRDELSWKSPQILIEMLIKTVSYGGNLLMNVGPCARGYFDARACNALEAYGEWMKYNSRSIYGCTMADSEFEAPFGTILTQSEDGKRLYIHLLSYPYSILSMKNMAGKIAYAQFVHDGSEVLFNAGTPRGHFGEEIANEKSTVFFNLPIIKPNTAVPVIELILK